jgi:hypothetical protein
MTTENTTSTTGCQGPFQPLLDFWNQYFEQSGEHLQTALDGLGNWTDPAAVRQRWQDALAKSLDQFMRTPAFLEMMRRQFETMIQLKSASEDWARDLSRSTGIPRISDISGLFERLQIGQEAILTRLNGIEKKLSALEARRKKSEV